MPLPEMSEKQNVRKIRDLREILKDPLQQIAEWRLRHLPVGGHILQDLVHGRKRGTEEENAIYQRIELCHKLHDIDPDNPIWNEAATFFSVYPRSADVAVSYLQTIGITCGKDRTLQLAPQWQKGKSLIEFMDVLEWLSRSNNPKSKGKDVQDLAKLLNDESWKGYREVKDDLTEPKESISVLIKPTIEKTLEAQRLSGCETVCVIGMSEDEANALAGNEDFAVVGLNIGISPELRKMRDEGKVILLKPEDVKDEKALKKLEKGKCYLIEGDATDGLPFADGTVVIDANFMLHHIPPEVQLKVVHEIARVSALIGEDHIQKAFVIGEDSDSFDLMLWELSLNPAVTAWDAIISQVRGVLTVQNLKKNQDELRRRGIALFFEDVCTLPDRLRGPLPYLFLMPVTQVLVTGWEK
jgi:hypothetical protein